MTLEVDSKRVMKRPTASQGIRMLMSMVVSNQGLELEASPLSLTRARVHEKVVAVVIRRSGQSNECAAAEWHHKVTETCV